jgi:hypothetical protein
MFTFCGQSQTLFARRRLCSQNYRATKNRRRGRAYVGALNAPIPNGVDWRALRASFRREAEKNGLLCPRVTSATQLARYDMYDAWVKAGLHGEMAWLAREDRKERRRDLQNVLPGVMAVISVAMPYWPGRG